MACVVRVSARVGLSSAEAEAPTEDTMSDLLRRYEELCEAEGEQLVDINVDIPKRTYVRMVHQLARALKDVRSQGQDTELRPDGQRREHGETKSDGGAPQTPAAERRSSDEEGWEEGYKACKAGAQQAGGAAVQEALAWADDHAAGLVRSLAQPSRARVATLAAEVRRLQAQPTAQEPPVLSLNEAYQRICDLFAYEENEKRLSDGLLHILRMATTPQRDSGLDALLREAREALWREHATGTPMHALRDYCTRCALIAKLDAAMQTRGQTDFVQRSSSDCTTGPGLSGDGSVAERK